LVVRYIANDTLLNGRDVSERDMINEEDRDVSERGFL